MIYPKFLITLDGQPVGWASDETEARLVIADLAQDHPGDYAYVPLPRLASMPTSVLLDHLQRDHKK